MILKRYSYRPVTAPLLLQRTVTHRRPPLPYHHRPSPNFTVHHRPFTNYQYIGKIKFLEKFKRKMNNLVIKYINVCNKFSSNFRNSHTLFNGWVFVEIQLLLLLLSNYYYYFTNMRCLFILLFFLILLTAQKFYIISINPISFRKMNGRSEIK